VEELFAPPGAGWNRVSPRLAVVRRTALGVAAGLAALALLLIAVLTFVPSWLVAVAAAVLAAVVGWGWWLIGRNAARWGYAELDEELYITRGALFRHLVVVPYGRMQYVDVQSGPIEQLNGIATVQMHTASPGTTAVIPGLPSDEAARLRDRLTALGEAQAAGL
jgi:membrane protein YdbS with pleckstrin-like domain